MAFTIEELSLNCIFSWENSLNNMKKKTPSSYIIATLFHGSSSCFEKPIVSQLDAQGRANTLIKFKGVNVESDYIRFQVLNDNQGKVFQFTKKKHVGTVYIRVSELLEGEQHSSSAVYEFKTTSWKHRKAELNLAYKVSNGNRKPEAEAAAAIGNDISLFKTLPSFHPPIVSLHWN